MLAASKTLHAPGGEQFRSEGRAARHEIPRLAFDAGQDNAQPMVRGMKDLAWRLLRGSAHNFTLRIGDWFLASVLGTFGLILLIGGTPSTPLAAWRHLWSIASPGEWGVVCVIGALIRLAALFINGTVPGFPWTPHIRVVACLLSCFLWFQLVLGLLLVGAVVPGWAFYPHILVFELYNMFVAASEAGQVHRRLGKPNV